MERADQLRAELEVVDLEAQLVKAKGEPKTCPTCGRVEPVKDTAKFRELKNKVREARRVAREAREANG